MRGALPGFAHWRHIRKGMSACALVRRFGYSLATERGTQRGKRGASHSKHKNERLSGDLSIGAHAMGIGGYLYDKEYHTDRDTYARLDTGYPLPQHGALITNIRGIILDLDGVVYQGSTLLPGVREFLAFLRDRQRRVIAVTNHSGASSRDYADKLKRMGVPLGEPDILTSAWAVAQYACLITASCVPAASLTTWTTRSALRPNDLRCLAVHCKRLQTRETVRGVGRHQMCRRNALDQLRFALLISSLAAS